MIIPGLEYILKSYTKTTLIISALVCVICLVLNLYVLKKKLNKFLPITIAAVAVMVSEIIMTANFVFADALLKGVNCGVLVEIFYYMLEKIIVYRDFSVLFLDFKTLKIAGILRGAVESVEVVPLSKKIVEVTTDFEDVDNVKFEIELILKDKVLEKDNIDMIVGLLISAL